MLRKAILLFPAILLLFGCPSDDEQFEILKGNLFVRATLDGNPLSGVSVETDPATTVGITDETGTVLLSDVEPGTYRVIGSRDGLVPVAVSATIRPDNATSAILSFVTAGGGAGGGGGGNPNGGPSLYFDYNSYGEVYLGDPVVLSGSVTDDRDPIASLPVVLTSSLDGILDTVYADGTNGRFTYSSSELSAGVHNVTANVTDSDGESTNGSVSVTVLPVPDPVRIDTIVAVSGGTEIRWTACDCDNLSSYLIEKAIGDSTGQFNQVGAVYDRSVTTYVDEEVQIGTTVYYRVSLRLGSYDGRLVTGVSEAYALNVDGFSLETGIVRMKADPKRPYLYGLDRVNNELLFINLEEQRVEKKIFVGSSPVDLDFSRSGDTLYIANFGSTQIAVVDIESQTKVRDLTVSTQGTTWQGNPYRLAILAGNRLAFTSEDQWNDVKLVNINTGTRLSNAGSVYYPGLLTNAAGDVLYVTESGSTGSSVIRFNLVGDELQQVSSTDGETNFGSRDATLTADGRFIYYSNKKILASNLSSQLGSFPEPIVTANSDGSLAVGESTIYNGETFVELQILPVASRIAVVAPDDNTLYVYDPASSYLIEIDLDEL